MLQTLKKTVSPQYTWPLTPKVIRLIPAPTRAQVALLLSRAECHMRIGDNENVLADTSKALKVRVPSLLTLKHFYADLY